MTGERQALSRHGAISQAQPTMLSKAVLEISRQGLQM